MMLFQHEYFEHSADRYPDSVAVDDHGKTLTYQELDHYANQLAHLLVSHGVAANERVCIFTEKNAHQYAAVLAALKSGGCWVPLSTAYPKERLAFLLETLQPKAIIVEKQSLAITEELIQSLGLDTTIVCTGDVEAKGVISEKDIAKQPTTRPEIEPLSLNDMAYIIFTSGSTGTPKGVVVTHENARCFMEQAIPYFGIEQGSRFAHFSELTFDPSVFDLFMCWATAGTLVPFNKRSYKINPLAFFQSQAIDVLFSVPSLIEGMKAAENLSDESLSSIKHLLLTGEPIASSLVRSWYDAHSGSTVYNMYGTTEIAIVSHWYKIPQDIQDSDPMPVGSVLPGLKVMLLDGDEEVATGEVGESVVYGAQVSPAYWANKFLTDNAFLPHPNPLLYPQRVYHTGDLLRQEKDGLYYYVGRSDSQVKVRGHRVELGEVENCIKQHEEIDDAVVIAYSPQGQSFDKQLYAFVKMPRGDEASLKVSLENKLPHYMLPSKLVCVKGDFPRNQNGKVDRQSLLKQCAS